ncbi:hypothetical protein SEA_LITTLEFELLA_17 [Gordonia phage LittleFella]|nr:hypothetical protein SEA_LITTLEFELLA_17 [Gordonia phage LittleFella]
MAKISFRYDDSRLRIGVREYSEKVDEMLRFIVDYHAAAGQRNMKLNAPWTDRTSAARNGLFTVTDHSPGHYTIVFSHSVHYGIWLEVKFSGRDAIIMPTVISQGQALLEDIRRALR